MKLAICGSRNIEKFDLSKYISADVQMIISGGAIGIDRLAEAYADEHKLSKCIVRPQYYKYPPKVAPIKRNEVIVRGCDKLLAIWDGQSNGTRYTIEYAKKLGKEVEVVIVVLE